MSKSNLKACWLAIGLCVVIEGLGAETNGPCRYLPLTSGTVPDPGAGSLIFYASDYHQPEIYASPDVPTMIAFGVNNRLPKDKPPPQIRLVFDLPAGFQVHGGRFVGKPIESKDMEIEGKKYTRFTIKAPTGQTRPGATELIVSTSLKAPQHLKAYYATAIDGQLCHQRTIPLYIISIPKVGAPKRIMTWFWPLHSVLDDYPDPDGFSKAGFAYPNAEYFEREIKSGARNRAEVDFLGFTVEGPGLAKDPEAVNVTLWGDKEGSLACPTYRGRNYRGLIEKGKRAIDLGVYEHFFDPERTDGKLVCFCPRCLARFKEWFTANSSLPYKEPREFMRNWRKFPDYCQLWVKFKVAQESERYSDYRREMLRYLREKGLAQDRFKLIFAASLIYDWGRKPEVNIERSLEDPLLLKEIVDYYCPMIYIEFMSPGRADLLSIAETLKSLRQYTNGQLAIYPILSVGYPYFSHNIEPNGMMKYQVLEAFAGGAKGIFIYSEGWFDALDMKHFADAMKQILLVEDIIADGKQIDEGTLGDLNAATFVKGVESKDGAVILVSEYSEAPKEAKVEYKAQGNADVVDLSTGNSIAKLSPEQPCFNVRLEGDRARLFYIGRKKLSSKDL